MKRKTDAMEVERSWRKRVSRKEAQGYIKPSCLDCSPYSYVYYFWGGVLIHFSFKVKNEPILQHVHSAPMIVYPDVDAGDNQGAGFVVYVKEYSPQCPTILSPPHPNYHTRVYCSL